MYELLKSGCRTGEVLCEMFVRVYHSFMKSPTQAEQAQAQAQAAGLALIDFFRF